MLNKKLIQTQTVHNEKFEKTHIVSTNHISDQSAPFYELNGPFLVKIDFLNLSKTLLLAILILCY